MPALNLSASFTVNERTRPLLDGLVSPEGMRLVTTGITPNEMFWRQLKFGDFDVSEMSMASLLIATSQGPTDWVALPIFTTRRFFHTRAAARVGSGIEKPEDLRGKRVGVPEYQQTAAVWTRGIFQHEFGLDPMDVIWLMGRSAERSHGGATGFTPPKGLRFSYVPPETDIAAMLLAGELDATLHYYLEPNLVDKVSTSLAGRAEVRPLFPDALAEGRRYYKKTGIYPINHCVVVRRSIFERNPWVAINLYSAFLAAKAVALKKATAILEPYRETGSLDGNLSGDPMPYGVQACRGVLETIAQFLYEQGLTERVVALDEIFAESTLDL
jgi:4,5-dihydroxyphthalate decarboxylase